MADGSETYKINTESLFTARGPTSLEWEANIEEVVLLTPSDKEGGKLLIAAVALAILSVVL